MNTKFFRALSWKGKNMKEKFKKNNAEYGFTLIELSIVLVLIGLLIGGVLKGQELIASTRLKMAVSQVDAIKAAFNIFQDKYSAIPGDYSRARDFISADIINQGNGNGIIGTTLVTLPLRSALGTDVVGNEYRAAWEHLHRSALLASIANDGNNWDLQSKIPGVSFNFLYATMNNGGATVKTAHWIRLQAGSGIAQRALNPLSGKEAAEIDRKYDDGNKDNGVIRGDTAVAGVNCVYGASEDKICALAFEL